MKKQLEILAIEDKEHHLKDAKKEVYEMANKFLNGGTQYALHRGCEISGLAWLIKKNFKDPSEIVNNIISRFESSLNIAEKYYAAKLAEEFGIIDKAIINYDKYVFEGVLSSWSSVRESRRLIKSSKKTEEVLKAINSVISSRESMKDYELAGIYAEEGGQIERAKELYSKEVDRYERFEWSGKEGNCFEAALRANEFGLVERAKQLAKKTIELFEGRFNEAYQIVKSSNETNDLRELDKKTQDLDKAIRVSEFCGIKNKNKELKDKKIKSYELTSNLDRAAYYAKKFGQNNRAKGFYERLVNICESKGDFKFAAKYAKECGHIDKAKKFYKKEIIKCLSNENFLGACNAANEAGMRKRAELYHKIYIKNKGKNFCRIYNSLYQK
jgi:hypothetical protein